MTTTYDLDLEPPIKQRLLIVEATTVYAVWVDDDDDRGAEALATDWGADMSDLADLIRDQTAVNGDIVVRVPDRYDPLTGYGREHGPWALCPADGCTMPGYPAYGLDTEPCMRHSVQGCPRRNLPEKTTW